MQTINIALDVVALFQSQTQHKGSVRLRSIKVALPNGCDANEVANWIVDNYPQYKAHSKDSAEGPMLAIGHR